MIASCERSACGVPARAASIARLPPTKGPRTERRGPATWSTPGAEPGALLEHRAHPLQDRRGREVPQGGDDRGVDAHEPMRDRMGEVVGQAVLPVERGQEGRGVREAEERAVGDCCGVAGQPDQVLEQVHGTEATPSEPDRLDLGVGHRPAQVVEPLLGSCPPCDRRRPGRAGPPVGGSPTRAARRGPARGARAGPGPDGAMTAIRAPGASSGPGRSGWLSNISTGSSPALVGPWRRPHATPAARLIRGGLGEAGLAARSAPGMAKGQPVRLPLRRGGGYGI